MTTKKVREWLNRFKKANSEGFLEVGEQKKTISIKNSIRRAIEFLWIFLFFRRNAQSKTRRRKIDLCLFMKQFWGICKEKETTDQEIEFCVLQQPYTERYCESKTWLWD